jgi:hypothetical protein
MMKIRQLLLGTALAIAATGVVVASAAERSHEAHMKMHGPHASVEFTAMHNIMAELLSAKTGKTVAEIQAAFEQGGPEAVHEKLGLSHEQLAPIFKEARATLITRAAAAGLITAEQAEKLRAAKVEMRHPGDDRDRDDHDR